MKCTAAQTLTVKQAGLLFYTSFDHPGDPVNDGGGNYHYTDEAKGVAMRALFSNGFDPLPGFPVAGKVAQGTKLGPGDVANTLVSDLVTIPYDPAKVPGVTLWGWYKTVPSGIDSDDIWIVGAEWGGAGWPIFDPNFSPNFNLAYNANVAQIRFSVWDDLGVQTTLSHAFNPTVNVWQFICATHNTQTGASNLYANGSTPISSGVLNKITGVYSQGKFAMGLDAGTHGSVIDECGISFIGAFTNAQVAQLYNSGAGITWPAVNSV